MIDLTNYSKINNNFFEIDTLDVCKEFIGCILKFRTENGIIVAKVNEIEAYLGENDKGSHTYKNKRTARTEPMFLVGGYLYVYFIYGMYYNLNFVTNKQNHPSGILLRGVEILQGKNIASINRYGKEYEELTKLQKRNLSNGPGKICQIYKITREHSAKHFSEFFKIYKPNKHQKFETTARIGIDYAGEDAFLPYRFILKE